MLSSFVVLGEFLGVLELPHTFFITDMTKYVYVAQKNLWIKGISEGEEIENRHIKYCLSEKEEVVEENLIWNGSRYDVWVSPLFKDSLFGSCGIYLKRTTDYSIFDYLSLLNSQMDSANHLLENKLAELKVIRDAIRNPRLEPAKRVIN